MTTIPTACQRSLAMLKSAACRAGSSSSTSAHPIAGPSSRNGLFQRHSIHEAQAKLFSTSSANALSATLAAPSGSNKWSKIRHKKAANDAAKGNVNSQLTAAIVSAVRAGGPNPQLNVRLAVLLKKAKEVSFPREKLEATIAKAQKSAEGGAIVSFDVMGPPSDSGATVALIVDCSSEDARKTQANVTICLGKTSKFARLSSVSHLFQRKGVVRLSTGPGQSFDQVFELALESGAEDVREVFPESEGEEQAAADQGQEKVIEVLCEPSQLAPLSQVLSEQALGHNVHEAELRHLSTAPLIMISEDGKPQEDVADEGEEIAGWIDAETMGRLSSIIADLEEKADCVRVWSNVKNWP